MNTRKNKRSITKSRKPLEGLKKRPISSKYLVKARFDERSSPIAL